MKGKIQILCLLLFILLAKPSSILGQPIFVDQPIQCGDLIVFPHITDSSTFYFLPNKMKLGSTDSGKPQFSFLRYVQNVQNTPGTASRDEGEGGGILHALVELMVTPEQILIAEEELKKKVAREDAKILGPVVYKGGQFSLISSFVEEGSDFTKKVVGVGSAPVFVGNKAAVSIRLTKLGTKILWESCQTPTPDLSFSFVMDFTGYRSPLQASIEVDFDKVYTHHGIEGGITVGSSKVTFGAEIKAAFDKLVEEGAIVIKNNGSDDKMDAIIDAAYKKLLDIMFAPFSMPLANDDSTLDKLGSGIQSVAQGIKKGVSLVSINVAYEMKKQRKVGKFVIDLSKSSTESISFRFDENLGSDVAKCKDCFTSVNLDDPFYKQRDILVSVDGLNADQFSKYINFVTVGLQKDHGGGDISIPEVRIAQKEFKEAAGNPFHLQYGWKESKDSDRKAWLKYKYRAVWSFFGDHSVVKDWTVSDQLAINVAPPFHPVTVSVESDKALLTTAGIRQVTIKFFYDFGAGEKMDMVTIKSTDANPTGLAEFMLKQDQYEYEYEINWRLYGNKTVTSGRKKSSDNLLYVDEIPAGAQVITN